MAIQFATGNHDEQCPQCGDFVPKNAVERASMLRRVNCPRCGWGVEYSNNR